MITCKEAVDRLWEYLDRSLDHIDEAALDAHLGVCRHCCGELEFSRRVRARLQAPERQPELAPAVRARLESFLRSLGARP